MRYLCSWSGSAFSNKSALYTKYSFVTMAPTHFPILIIVPPKWKMGEERKGRQPSHNMLSPKTSLIRAFAVILFCFHCTWCLFNSDAHHLISGGRTVYNKINFPFTKLFNSMCYRNSVILNFDARSTHKAL